MRSILLIVISLNLLYCGYGQYNQQKKWKELIKSKDFHLKKYIDNKDQAFTSVDVLMKKAINAADETFSLPELTSIVNICSRYCNNSPDISISLVKLLREDHPIYKDKTPTEVNQFRA